LIAVYENDNRSDIIGVRDTLTCLPLSPDYYEDVKIVLDKGLCSIFGTKLEIGNGLKYTDHNCVLEETDAVNKGINFSLENIIREKKLFCKEKFILQSGVYRVKRSMRKSNGQIQIFLTNFKYTLSKKAYLKSQA
jgi:hypothetical protein